MGFIDSFNKSVFTKSSYAEAVRGKAGSTGGLGHAVIRIQAEGERFGADYPDPYILGVVKEGVSFEIRAKYSDLGGLGAAVFPKSAAIVKGAFEKFNALASTADVANFGAVYASKKIYQKSEYLVIKPQFRVVDWQGIGQPVMTAKILALYTTPVVVMSGKEVLKAAGDAAKPAVQAATNTAKQGASAATAKAESAVDKAKAEIDEMKKSEKKLVSTVGNFLDSSVENFEGAFNDVVSVAGKAADAVGGFGSKVAGSEPVQRANKNVLSDIDDVITVRSSPMPVKVWIGKFFHRSDMIIESIDYKFSKEMTAAGPLYVDIGMTLSSRKIIGSLEDIGLNIAEKKSRVLGSNATGVTGG